MQKNQTYYDTLKVTRDAPTAVIQAAFKALMQLNHPENFTGREDESVLIAIQLREAYDVLSTSETREQYDRWLDKEAGKSNAATDTDSQDYVKSANRIAA
ncbi:DnaJ domain-containing protein [Methylomonas sp. SURF-2]|uniref:DnaJ domain-containing protein n=1 Tax=Methylomonas subterranea TaxID=2952225 RepID=A0ABT1TE48_9GAMM|nr:DnaJ domain-containing protein [Methylomonas sp. SURF-2]MCQ8103695.1 DnaJ domain-containing protein [Methylomonas sp. SURF-2]